MRNINIIKKDTSFEMFFGNKPIGLLKAYITRPGNNQFYCPWPCEAISFNENNEKLVFEFRRDDEGIVATLMVSRHSDNLTGKFTVSGKGYAVVKLIWELPKGKKGFPFIPAFMYGFNEGGKSQGAIYPQLDDSNRNISFANPWVQKEWLVRADRSSHCLTSVITDEYTYVLGGRDVCRYSDGAIAEKNGLGVSSDDPHRISFSLGFFNVPYTYSAIGGRNFFCRPEGYLNLDKGAVDSEFFLSFFESRNRQEAATRILRESYSLLHDNVNSAGTVKDAIISVSEALVNTGYNEKAINFYTSIHDDSRKDIELHCECFTSGWAGGSRVAYPLLVAGHQLKKPKWVNFARSVLSNLAENAISKKSELFFENYNLNKNQWDAKGWWYPMMENPGHSGYINGQVCHYLLKGYLFEKQAGVEQLSWLKAANLVLDHIARTQGNDGRFGYTYNEENGMVLDDIGFGGCWFTPAFASLYKITGEKKYFNIAKKAMDFYRKDVAAFHVFGCPHDIWKSPDEEGIIAWIEAARILHEITKEDQFLKDLLIGLDYEFSWKFAYNVVNEIEPLKSMKWCSTGGSVTSVNNSHIHPMGSAIAAAILYAYEQTKDEYLKLRLIDTVRWTLTIYLHFDGEYGWGKKGLVNERFCYTDSLLNERFPDGSPASTWFCGHSWASGAVLEGLVGEILDMEKKNKTIILGK